MPNSYHDAAGRFTSREGQVKRIADAIRQGDITAYLNEKAALDLGDRLSNYTPTAAAKGEHPALASKDADAAELKRVLSVGSEEEVEYFITERIERPEYLALLKDRDDAKERARLLNDEHRLILSVSAANPSMDFETVREKGFEALDAYETLQVLKNKVDEYKHITAPAANRLSELIQQRAEADGTWREYTEYTLGALQATGNFESGSREWLEQRQSGIGGSDVGKIIGTEPKYAAREYEEVLKSKLQPISDEQVEQQTEGHTSFEGATGRGNAWENLIVNKFAEANPDLGVTHCKTSWQHSDRKFQYANFDGLLTDENGVPNGILEIKTAADATKWGDTASGLDGVPSGYRAQVLWYASAANFNRGAIAVMIDDHDYREYHFTMTPELQAEAAANLAAVKEFTEKVERYKKGGAAPEPLRSAVVNKGFSSRLLAGKDKARLEAILAEAAVYREETVDETRARFSQLASPTNDPEENRNALTRLYAEIDPATRKRPIVAVDIETSGSTPTSGHIIEVGISTRAPGGGEAEKHSVLYGLTRKALAGKGTGAVEVHGIDPGKIAKKRGFRHPTVQKEVLEKLKGGTLMAHNASYELRWFRQHLDGFAAAEKRGEIRVIDTMKLSRYLVPDTPDNKLESFSERFGVPYLNSHRAYNDSRMMAEAFEGFSSELHENFLKQ